MEDEAAGARAGIVPGTRGQKITFGVVPIASRAKKWCCRLSSNLSQARVEGPNVLASVPHPLWYPLMEKVSGY